MRTFLVYLVGVSLVIGLVSTTGATSSTIEDFDDGDITDYTFVSSCSGPTISAAAAHDGPFGLKSIGGCWIYRDDAAVQVSQGDVLSVWVQFSDAVDGRAYFGFGASAAGTLSFVLAPNTGDIRFQENPNFGFTSLDTSAQSFVANKWYRAEVEWGLGGSLTGRLYDSDGQTLLNTVTSASTLFTSGGIAFRGFSSVKAFDTVTVVVTPPPPLPPVGVQNGGFETCTLADWDVASGSVASAVTSLGPSGQFTPILPAEGQCMAFLSTAGSAPTPPGTLGSVISQTFIMPADASTLKFCYQYVSNDSSGFENFFLAELETGLGSFTLGSADNATGSPAGGFLPPPPPPISAGVTLNPNPAPIFLSGVNILGSALFVIPSSLMTDRVCSSFSVPGGVLATEVTLRFTAGDAIDTIFDSAVVVDAVSVSPPPPPGPPAVGGIAGLLDESASPAEASGSSSARDYTAPIAAAVAAGALALAAGGWYARRRLLR